MKVALVYDWVNKYGGAERVIQALHAIWPKAPLYTAVYDRKKATWADSFKVYPSFLQNIPFAKSHHELFPFLIPLSFESFNFDEYDVVISVTSFAAKGIITKPKTLHLCYCLTPTRFLWSGYNEYKTHPGLNLFDPITKLLFPPIAPRLRAWDFIASSRPDIYLTISETVKKRINKYYRKDATVIYPGIDCDKFSTSTTKRNSSFFLVVSRFVPYKKIDIAIYAANKLRLPLKIIGSGSQLKYLKSIAGETIDFIKEHLTDEELVRYYQNCAALIFIADEDFGLAMLEAQACGKPVISFKGDSAKEIIIEGVTGDFFYPQTADALIKVLKNFNPHKYTSFVCRENAKRFNQRKFLTTFKKIVEDTWQKWQKNQI